ncbi:unnamed protein product, partial [Amoebophrya sp. A120]|eukprot:GSA120T00008455001.1
MCTSVGPGEGGGRSPAWPLPAARPTVRAWRASAARRGEVRIDVCAPPGRVVTRATLPFPGRPISRPVLVASCSQLAFFAATNEFSLSAGLLLSPSSLALCR